MKLINKTLLACLVVTGISYSAIAPIAMAQQKTEDRHLSGFHALEVAGPFDVRLSQGATESVKVEAPEEVIGRITTEVNNGVLKVYNKHNENFHWGDAFHHRKILVYVTVKDINSIMVTGSGDVAFTEGIHADRLTLHVSGSGDVNGMLEVKDLEAGISGSGDVKLSGHADNSQIRISGSGDYSARGLHTSNTSVHISGSGDASVYVTDKLDASVSGSGDISYSGSPKSVLKSKSGSGDIGGN